MRQLGSWDILWAILVPAAISAALGATRRFSARGVLVLAAISAALGALNLLHERRSYRRKAALVRLNLVAMRCARCDGDLGAWDGRFESGDAHFNPGGYWPRITVCCNRCQARQVFYVPWDGRLFNSDKIFGPAVADGREA